MHLRLATALLFGSALAAQAQFHAPSSGSSTPAAQMSARANANANQALDTAAGAVTSLPPDDASQPSGSQRIIRGQVNGALTDPLLHYPYGRYGATLGNIDPSSLANPFTRSPPGTVPPQNPFATSSGTQGSHRDR